MIGRKGGSFGASYAADAAGAKQRWQCCEIWKEKQDIGGRPERGQVNVAVHGRDLEAARQSHNESAVSTIYISSCIRGQASKEVVRNGCGPFIAVVEAG